MIDVEIEDEAWSGALPGCEAVVRLAAEAALATAQRPGEVSLTILLTGDPAVQDLNGRFRGQDKPTNVLSFPAAESAGPYLGDVAMAFGVCAAEARCQHKSLADHLSHLTVHGVLHLLGYDHEADHEAEVMEDMERSILKRLGVRDPYAWAADA
ncbi:MAG: rRNA maturation RNase YbeY [Caulobacter vibrioides]|uniref:Endoribonuclease YbeY n=1 Tax=Caulobacter vibrioides TaxID=155892 RepID=A0A258DFT9_CAUVI|nr:MAG: rRNA maturation RNase YbeY [Caulobacter vibrioides]